MTKVRFREPARARENLLRVKPRLGAVPERSLMSLLAQMPDPDGSANLLERFTESAPEPVLEYLGAHPTALHYLLAVFSYSAFLSESLLRQPDLIIGLHQDPSLFRLKSREEMLAEHRDSPMARAKRREYLRIMLRDVLELATLSEVTIELSALADALLENALLQAEADLQSRFPRPNCAFTVLSLGKLGGNELNYSSDIDLLFLYRSTSGVHESEFITHKEYFIQLAGRISGLITASSPEGRVFRVDLRLRPQGREGEAVHSLPAALDYYRRRARDWELQALVKARHSAGDAALAREFLEEVQPLVYRGVPNFAALDSVVFARKRMSEALRKRHSQALDVKLGRGGIRDIEFLVQCLQRLYGGQDPWLRSGGTLFAMEKLADKGWLTARDHNRLSRVYQFLRVVEHRLQLVRDQQTHSLPERPEDLDLLAHRAGMKGEEAGRSLAAELARSMGQVREIYDRVVHGAQTLKKAGREPAFALHAQASPSPSEIEYPQLLLLLEGNYPALHAAVRSLAPERGRKDMQRFLISLYAHPSALAALAASPEDLLSRAAIIFEESPCLSELLIHNPADIEALRDVEFSIHDEARLPLALPPQTSLDDPQLDYLAASETPLPEKMAALRRHYRRRLLHIQSRSVLAAIPVFDTLEATTRLAEQVIRAALASLGESSFTVVALGRLGVREFDLGSDADLAFFSLPADPESRLHSFRLAERLIEFLSSHTREGTIFAVDTRLRPRGREGELVESARYVEEYFRSRAEPWEAITYMKSRPLAGDMAGGTDLLTRVQNVIGARFGSGPEAARQLVEMRRRLEATTTPHNFLKTAAGGYYDIDFLLTFLRLRATDVFYPSLNTLERLDVVEEMGQLRKDQAGTLRQGAIFLRALQHALRILSGRSGTELPLNGPAAAPFARLAERWFPEPLRGLPLSDTLTEVMAGVRRVFQEVFTA